MLVCCKASYEHGDDDPHETECAFDYHAVPLYSYACLLFNIAASRIVSATTAWVWGPNTPKKLFCTFVSACWAKSEAKASARGANSWCSHRHGPFVVDGTVRDESVSPLALDRFDEKSFAIVFGDVIWFWSFAIS